MEPSAYDSLNTLKNSWWFLGKKKLLTTLVNKFIFKSPSIKNTNTVNKSTNSNQYNILEIGAGTGSITELLLKIFPKANVTAIEMEERAINYFKQNLPNTSIKQGYLPNNLPQLDYKQDAIFLVDVLEHVKEHKEALNVLYNLLNKDGYLYIDVPAFQFLWSDNDETAHHFRRYNKKRLVYLLKQQGFEVKFASYYTFFLFFPVWILRAISSIFTKEEPVLSLNTSIGSAASNKLPSTILKYICYLEAFLLKYIKLPFGNNLVVIAKKVKD